MPGAMGSTEEYNPVTHIGKGMWNPPKTLSRGMWNSSGPNVTPVLTT